MRASHIERRSLLDEFINDESGMALMVVMGVAAILFLLSTMILGLVFNSQLQSMNYVARTKAMHMADAGLNAYLYELRRDPNYYIDHPSLGPTTLEDGVWSVTVTPPQGDDPMVVRSVGSIPSIDASRTVVASVRFPTYADYIFLADTDVNIGSGATIDGKVRSNGDVDNDGHVTGKVEAAGRVSGSGRFDQGYAENVPRVDFAQVTADLADIRQVAGAIGTYYSPSGRQGYMVTFQNNRARIEYVTGGTSTGNLTTYSIGTVNIPAEGVFYFDDRVWVSGTYSSKVTIASSSDIYVHDDLLCADLDSIATCGLIARDNVIVPTWYSSLPTNMEIDAAMLAQNGAVYGDLKTGYIKNHITIRGSMAYRAYGYFAQSTGNSVTAGFRNRDYLFDPRLDLEPPPMYPQIKDGTLKVSTWVEQR